MSNREEIIARSVRDYENKANSLYTRGYNEGHRDGCSFARKMGMQDAWDLIRNVLEMPIDDFIDVFNGADCLEDISYMDIHEIEERMDKYKEKEVIDIDLTDGRPQGEWIEHKWIEYNEELMLEMPMHNYECSKCHSILHEVKETNFCPNCGAKMKGADDE